MNRVYDPRFPDDLFTVIAQGFYGWRRVSIGQIRPFYLQLARTALDSRGRGWKTWEHNALYMLSRDDLAKLGLSPEGACKQYSRGRWAVYLFEEWPNASD